MSFTDHKITAFQHKIADLADQPTLPPDDLKSRFDACPEELRVAHNAVCDDAARLEARVEGIVVDTFGDTIDKEMLSDELAAELDGKATQSALASETAARESADSAEAAARTALAETVAQKCEMYIGTYTGNGSETREITIGVHPKAMYLCDLSGSTYNGRSHFGGFGIEGAEPNNGSGSNPKSVYEITDTGFRVFYDYGNYLATNQDGKTYKYVVLV